MTRMLPCLNAKIGPFHLRLVLILAAPLALALTSASYAGAQTFDVGSVKAIPAPPSPPGGGITVSGSRITIRGYSLLGLLMYCYDVQAYLIVNAQQLSPVFYEIVGQIEDGKPRTRADFKPYVKNLLAERFKLQTHWQEKESDVYTLVVSKGGVKFEESPPDAEVKIKSSAMPGNFHVHELTWTGATMEDFAAMINDRFFGLDRIVVNETGLVARYNIKVAYAPYVAGAPPLTPDEPDIMAALPGQLGLLLKPKKATVKLLAVDHVERPSEN
jgi:uncharacterized protein (TIGR03435 family)